MDRQGQQGNAYRRDPYGDEYHGSPHYPPKNPSMPYGPNSGPRGPGRPRDFERASYNGPSSSAGHYYGDGGNAMGGGSEAAGQGRRLSYTRRAPDEGGYARRQSSPDQAAAGDSWPPPHDRRYSRDSARPAGYGPNGGAPSSPKWRGGHDAWSDAVEPPRKRLNLGLSPPRSTDYANPWAGQRGTYERRAAVESEEEGEMESDPGSYRSTGAGREREPTFGERPPRNGRMSLLPRDDRPHQHKPRPDFDSTYARHRTESAGARYPADSHAHRITGVRRPPGAFLPPTSDTGWAARGQQPDGRRSISRSPRSNGRDLVEDASPSAPRRSSNDSDASFNTKPAEPVRSMSRTPPLPPPEEDGVRTPAPARSPTPRSSLPPATQISRTPPLPDEAASLTAAEEPTTPSPPPKPIAPTPAAEPPLSPVKQEADVVPSDPLSMEERARRMGLLPPSPVRPAAESAAAAVDAAAAPTSEDVTEAGPAGEEKDSVLRKPTPPRTEDSDMRSRSPSPTIATPAPALDFDGCLGEVLNSYREDYQEDVVRLASTRARPSKGRVLRPRAPMPSIEPEVDSFELLGPFICDLFKRYDDLIADASRDLKAVYRDHQTDWQEHCDALDHLRSRLKRKPAATPITPSIDPYSGLPVSEPAATPGPSSGRSTRRTAMNTFGLGDAVRSEAEFQEILASLENADLRDPNMRAMRTTAVVPDMALTAEEQSLLLFDDDNNRVADPYQHFGLDDPGPLWTDEEEETFRRRYAQYPKQFGKIAAKLPEKTRADCVTYYYRTKHSFDYRALLDRRGLQGRKKKGRRFVGRDSKSTGKSLLANIKPAIEDEDDADEEEEDESMVDSPATGTVPLPRDPYTPSGLPRARSIESLAGSASRNGGLAPSAQIRTDVTVNGKFPSVLRPPNASGDAQAFLSAMSTLRGERPGDGAAMTSTFAFADGDDKAKARRKPKALTPTGTAGGEAGPKRRLGTSSYWTKDEKAQFTDALKTYGKDWKSIAGVISNKTATQCKNYFQNHAKKLGLAELVDGGQASTDAEEQQSFPAQGAPVGRGDYTVPLGVPLQQSIQTAARVEQPRPPPLAPPTFPSGYPDAARRLPQTGFFSSAPHQPPQPPKAAPTQPTPEQPRQSSMNLRNLLNDDATASAPTYMDAKTWFGGDAEDDASTEDEREVRPAAPAPAPATAAATSPPASRPRVEPPGSAQQDAARPNGLGWSPAGPPPLGHARLGQPGRYIPDIATRTDSLIYRPPPPRVTSPANSFPSSIPSAAPMRSLSGYSMPPSTRPSSSSGIGAKLPSLSGGMLGSGFAPMAGPPMQRASSMDHRPSSNPMPDYNRDRPSYLPPPRPQSSQPQPYLPGPPRRVASDEQVLRSSSGHQQDPPVGGWQRPPLPAAHSHDQPQSAPLLRAPSYPPMPARPPPADPPSGTSFQR